MAEPYRLVIAGGSDFNDYGYLMSCCVSIVNKIASQHEVIIVSGHAKRAGLIIRWLRKRKVYGIFL